MKVEYNGWVDTTKLAYTTDGSTPAWNSNPQDVSWKENGPDDGTGEPQLWEAVQVIPAQSSSISSRAQ